MLTHLSHPDDEVAVQALGFLRVVLYLGNTEAQRNIGHLTGHQNTKFFIRISQLLEGVVTSLGRPVLRLELPILLVTYMYMYITCTCNVHVHVMYKAVQFSHLSPCSLA